MTEYNYHDFLALMGVGGAHPGGLSFTKHLLKNVQIDQNSRVLDAGCGTGQTAAYIAETYGCHVTAIDRHPVMIEKAKQRFEANNIKVDLIQGNIEQMPFVDASFDFILIESVTVFTNIDLTISEYTRTLRQGGVLLDLEMTAIPPLTQAMKKAFEQLYGIQHIPSEKEWQNKYEQAGLHSFEMIDGNSVEESLHKHLSQTDNEEAPEFSVSPTIDPTIHQIWDEHQLLTETYADKLNYRVYKVNL